ncbi:outer membrane protein [Bradyrhizobium sp.]|uniref:outer membrane protein n=1 Tax=Bradyrhizobium sp. TaxID=376 RepID=UPI003C754051
MRRLLFAQAAVLAVSLAGPAVAADLPVKSEVPYVAPRFSWTSCYLGGHIGGGWASKDMTDPVFLVQDNLIGAGTTTGINTVGTSPTGVVIGGQIGCDYQFASNVVVGIEGSASGSTMKGSKLASLVDSPPDVALVQANTDFLASVTGRIGYAFDNVLLYGRGGFAMAGDKYNVSGGTVAGNGTPFDFLGVENRIGWVVGGGVDWAFSRHWSMNVEYDYYQFGTRSILMADQVSALTGLVDVKQNIQVVKLGFNFHIWGAGL